VPLLSLQKHLFSSQLEISHVLNGPTAKTNTDVDDLISFSQFLLHDLEKKVQFLMHDKEKRGYNKSDRFTLRSLINEHARSLTSKRNSILPSVI
jgi:hypothetical protein